MPVRGSITKTTRVIHGKKFRFMGWFGDRSVDIDIKRIRKRYGSARKISHAGGEIFSIWVPARWVPVRKPVRKGVTR